MLSGPVRHVCIRSTVDHHADKVTTIRKKSNDSLLKYKINLPIREANLDIDP